MLQPKKTKFRRQQKGRMKGNAQRGNQLVFGSFGIKTLESCSSVSLKDIEDFQLDTFKNSDKLFYTNYLKEYLGSIGNINYAT